MTFLNFQAEEEAVMMSLGTELQLRTGFGTISARGMGSKHTSRPPYTR